MCASGEIGADVVGESGSEAAVALRRDADVVDVLDVAGLEDLASALQDGGKPPRVPLGCRADRGLRVPIGERP